MALVNHAKREINAKIVVCGPSSAGKATLLKSFCSKLPAEERGPLRSMALQNDKMLFFDFTHPEGGDPERYTVRFHVYTLTGAVSHEHSWKMVLKGVDGIAFVADSDPTRQSANQLSMNQLRGALVANSKSLDTLSTVVLSSKRDIPDALPMKEISATLDIESFPFMPVSPISGEGVSDALAKIVAGIVAELHNLGFSLQKPVMSFLGHGPEISAVAEITKEVPLVAESAPAETPTAEEIPPSPAKPTLAVAGPPEIDPSGTIRIPVRIGCCGTEAVLHLSVSLAG